MIFFIENLPTGKLKPQMEDNRIQVEWLSPDRNSPSPFLWDPESGFRRRFYRAFTKKCPSLRRAEGGRRPLKLPPLFARPISAGIGDLDS
jgi:hypothetical protein